MLGGRWIRENDANIREITDVDLWDVSVVTLPAYPQTTAEVRTLEELAGGGFNVSAVAAALIRAGKRLEREKGDHAILSYAAGRIRSASEMTERADDPTVHERLNRLRRRLELARVAL